MASSSGHKRALSPPLSPPHSPPLQSPPRSPPLQSRPHSPPLQSRPHSPPLQSRPHSPPLQLHPHSPPLQSHPHSPPLQSHPHSLLQSQLSPPSTPAPQSSPSSPPASSRESRFQEILPYLRRPGKEPEEPDKTSSSRPKAKRRRILVKDVQELTRFDNYNLQLDARELFYSSDPKRLKTLVLDFAASSNQNPQLQVKALWNYCAHNCPNALSLKLAHLFHSPSLHYLRDHAVALLHRTLTEIHGKDIRRIHHRILSRLEPLLLHALVEMENSVPNAIYLSEIVANVSSRVFLSRRIWDWNDLLEYFISSLNTVSELKQEIALRIFLGLPDDCPQLTQFWQTNSESIYLKFWELFDYPNPNIQALTFDASVRLVHILFLNSLVELIECDDMLTRMTTFLQSPQTDSLLPKVQAFADLAKHHAGFFLNDLNTVFQCVIQIAETADDDIVLRCAAIKVLKELEFGVPEQISELMNLSIEDNRRLIKLSVRMMLHHIDDPNWYDVNIYNSEVAGLTDTCLLGRFLLDRICFGGQEKGIISLGLEMIPSYLIAEDWQARHAGMIAFAAMGERCSSEMINYFDHAERMLDMSLDDPHPRVCWAALYAIKSISGHTVKGERAKHVQYLLRKFLPKLIILAGRSHFTRLQVLATVTIRFLVKKCSDDDILPVLEDLVNEMLNLLKEDEQKLQEEAMDTLKLISSSFPMYFRGYYDTTMDSLKSILLINSGDRTKILVRVKAIECMGDIILLYQQDGFQDAIQMEVW